MKKTSKRILMHFIALCLVLTLVPTMTMQYVGAASTQVTAAQAVAAMLGEGLDAFVSNIQSQGCPTSIGTFSASGFGSVANHSAFVTEVNPTFFTNGVVLSTGQVSGTFTTTNRDVGPVSVSANSRITTYLGGSTGNSTSLSFDVTIPPGVDELSFTYFFMSVEFNQSVNDGFALWVYPADQVPTTTAQLDHYNIARLPNGNAVTVSDLNTGKARTTGTPMDYALWTSSTNNTGGALGGHAVRGNGVSGVMVANASDLTIHDSQTGAGDKLIAPGKTVTVEMSVRNTSDTSYQSEVFVKANSIGFSADGSGSNAKSNNGINPDTGHGFITVEKTDTDYTYVIVDVASDTVVARANGTGNDITFSNLMPGQKYKILVYDRTRGDIPAVGATAPFPDDDSADPPEDITLPVVDSNVIADVDDDGTPTATIVINPSSNTVKYAVVYDGGADNGKLATGTDWINGNGGEIKFEGLDPAKKYRIVTVPIDTTTPPTENIEGGDEVTTPSPTFVDIDDDDVERSTNGLSITIDPTVIGQEYNLINLKTGAQVGSWRAAPGGGSPGDAGGAITFSSLDPTASYQVITRTAGSPPSLPGEGITVRGREAVPAASISYLNGQLTGLVAGAGYTVNGTNYTATAGGTIDIASGWYGTPISIVKRGIPANNTDDSGAQTLAIPARPGAPSAVGGINQITGVTTAMEYRPVGGSWQDVPSTTISGVPAGTYEVRTKATGSAFAGASASVTVISPEDTPAASVNYTNGQLTGLVPGAVYIIGGSEYTADSGGGINIASGWYGTTIGIIKKGVGGNTDSDTQNLPIAAIPAAPTGIDTTPATVGENNGTITGVTSAQEYRLLPGGGWADISGSPVTGLAPGSYEVRVKATGSAPASNAVTVTVGGKESVPAAAINYTTEQITGLVPGAVYIIEGTEYTADSGGNVNIASGWYGTTIGVIRKGTGDNSNSDAQSLAISARPDAPTAPSGGGGQIDGVDDTMQYRLLPDGEWVDVPEGVTTLTGLPFGEYEVRVKPTGNTFEGEITTITVNPILETTPDAGISFEDKYISGLEPNTVYIVTVDGTGIEIQSDENGNIAIESDWFGKSIGIAKKGDDIYTIDSGGQTLAIPSIPNAPTGVVGGENQITGVNNTMEYRLLPSGEWTAVTGTSATGLPAGTYEVRVRGTGNSFVGLAVTVTVTDRVDLPYVDSDTPIVVEIGDGSAMLEIETCDTSPYTVLNTPVAVVFEIVFTEEEFERIENGEDARVFIIIEDISETISEEDKAMAEEALENDPSLNNFVFGLFLDITKFKQIGNDDPKQLFVLSHPIKISFEIPEELRVEGREFKIIRIHDGEIDIISGTYDHATGMFTFETDRFSTYALVYSDDDNPTTGVALGFTAAIIVGSAAGFSRKRKNHNGIIRN